MATGRKASITLTKKIRQGHKRQRKEGLEMDRGKTEGKKEVEGKER